MQVDTEFKNAKYDPTGTITCDIKHPDYGWIPFTASEFDVELHGRMLFEHIKATGSILAADK